MPAPSKAVSHRFLYLHATRRSLHKDPHIHRMLSEYFAPGRRLPASVLRAPHIPIANEHELTPNPQRRRAQNRASQRAFRERKERHVKGLESQLELLHEKHQDLLCSYNRQAEGIEKLNSKIAKLTGDLSRLRTMAAAMEDDHGGQDTSARDDKHGHNINKSKSMLRADAHCKHAQVTMPRMPDTFDAFSFVSTAVPTLPRESSPDSQGLYHGYDLSIEASDLDDLSDRTHPLTQTLPEFEDLLDMH
jgi:hypothetical protein